MRPALAFAALGFLVASSLSPNGARAGYRGAFDPLTVDSKIWNRYESPALRPQPEAGGVELYFAFTTRSQTVGREACRQIWLHRNISRAGLALGDVEEARQPLLLDPTAHISYM
ncbi:MAG TPA: hypothetical protein VIX13_03245, partial [Candidatus Eisenbacteria bacterium]